MTATSPAESSVEAAAEHTGPTPGTKVIESLFDNLSLWTVIAAAIALLYLIWVTLDVLAHYVPSIPKVGP